MTRAHSLAANEHLVNAGPYLRGYSSPSPQQPDSRVPGELGRSFPADTLGAAEVSAGIRLEMVGTATTVQIGFRSTGATARFAPTLSNAFSVWVNSNPVSQLAITPDQSHVTVSLPSRAAQDIVTIYLPEPTAVRVDTVTPRGGTLESAPHRPRLVAYGDSITQGWSVSDPGYAWLEVLGRKLNLETVNLGYAGAARGEQPAAAHVAAVAADIIVLAWGTNCWSTVPYDEDMIASAWRLFLRTVRQGHPDTDILAVSPIVRTKAERSPNRYGATLVSLRGAIESSITAFTQDFHDDRIHLIPGEALVPESLLVDGIHPGDDGHREMASGIADVMQRVAARR